MNQRTSEPTARQDRAVFGRRKGKRLRGGHERLVETLLPRLRLDLSSPAAPGIEGMFGRPVREIWLEIGFGGGEHLARLAGAFPDIGFIGCEPFVNGMAKMLALVDRDGLDNICLHDGDASDVLRWLPEASISRVYLLYPDPWPKRRQNKRRFVSAERLAMIARVLRHGGRFRFASDIDDYVAWTLAHQAREPALSWRAAVADDWRQPWPGWTRTRYEAKAIREGRRPTYLDFRRV